MKHLNKKSVIGIVASIAHGASIETTATQYGISPLSVSNVIRGITHADMSGLSGDNVGVKYLRANKDNYPMAKKSTKVKVKVETDGGDAPAVETEVKDTPVVATVRKSRTVKETPVKVVTLEDRAKNIVSEAVQIVTDCETEMCRMETEIETKLREIEAMRSAHATMMSHRDHWKAISEQLNPNSKSADAHVLEA